MFVVLHLWLCQNHQLRADRKVYGDNRTSCATVQAEQRCLLGDYAWLAMPEIKKFPNRTGRRHIAVPDCAIYRIRGRQLHYVRFL